MAGSRRSSLASLAITARRLAPPGRLAPLAAALAASLAAAAALAQTPPAAAGRPQYVGAGSCGASNCHGSVRPRTDIKINQNEYAIWATKDRHAKAFAVLSNPLGVRIAKNLGLARPTDARCTACHALDVPAAEKARPFDVGDGVGCESCHGPASNWIGPHFMTGWTHAQSVQAGMVDTKDVARRTARCASCHVGDDARFVDHEMIAAGHPDLFFELSAFSAEMPMHWKEPKDPGHGVRLWSVGQGVHLRSSLERLAGRARGKTWPEYAEHDCFACHHALTTPEESWRQQQGFPGRKPGHPAYNLSRWAVFRSIALKVDAEGGRALESEIAKLDALVSRVAPPREEVAASAARAIELLEAVLRKVASATYGRADALDLVQRIAADADAIAGRGERAAEQAAMSLETLFRQLSAAGGEGAGTAGGSGPGKATAAELDAFFQLLQKPSLYDPRRAAEHIRKIGGTLR